MRRAGRVVRSISPAFNNTIFFQFLRPAYSMLLGVALASCGLASVSVLFSGEAMAAQSTACPTVLLGADGNICTASDVKVAAAISGLGGQTAHCIAGELYVVNLIGTLEIRKNSRWDIGVFVASDGKDMTVDAASGGAAICEVAPLPAINLQRDGAAEGEAPVMGAFDTSEGLDQCGDTKGLQNGDQVTGFPITEDNGTFNGPVTLTCVAGPNGKLQLQSLVSWNQSDPGFCDPTNPADYELTQISKCSTTTSELEVEIVGRVTIRKEADNGGLSEFDFTYTNNNPPAADTITNPASTFPLKDGESVEIYAEIASGPATIVVDESNLPPDWQFSSISCTGDDTTAVTVNGSEVTVTLSYNSNDPASSQSEVECTYTNIEIIREVSLDKTTTTADYDSTDDSISYSYAVGNAGNIRLAFPVSVSDDKVAVSCPLNDGGAPNNGDAFLDPGESVDCSASYDVSQADIDSGSVINTADATVAGVTSPKDSVTVNAVQSPAMTVLKSSPTSEITSIGPVSYSYLVSNTGNVTLTGISLSDNNDEDDMSCPATTLSPGNSMTCTASHNVIQAEIDAGGNLSNTVIASSAETANVQTSLDIPITQSPSLLVVKDGEWKDDGSIAGVAEVGETIDYTILVSNNGNVTLTSIDVTDPLITGAPNNGTISCNGGANPIVSLAPGAGDTCTATYFITAEDLVAKSRDNTATGTSGSTSDSGSDTVTLPDVPGLILDKEGTFQDDITADGFAQVGETISYTFDVTNAGETPATQVSVTDSLITGTISCAGGSNPIANLAGGETVQCTASYTLTQDDVDRGFVYNLATADSVETAPTTDDNTEILPQYIDWSITKSGVFQDESNDGLAQPDETILFTFVVENTGFVTLTEVAVTDPKVAVISCDGGNPIPSVAPSATVNCTGSYLVTQADIDAGQVENIGTGNPVETPPEESETTTSLPQRAAIAIVKSSATKVVSAPLTVLYSYLVTNTGNVTLTGIDLVDSNVDGVVSCPADTLAPEGDLTCSAARTVTEQELEAGGSPIAGSGVLYNEVVASSNESEEATDDLSIPMNDGTALTFRVTKYFSDNNPAMATIQLTCNTDLPLRQTFRLGDTDVFNITVADFEPGVTDCRVQEILNPVDNYTAIYLADADTGEAGDVRSEPDGCYFDDVEGGAFICDITNQVDAVAADVYKVWSVPNEGSSVTRRANITIWCDAEIEGGLLDQASGNYYQVFNGVIGDQKLTAMVFPELPSSKCWAMESGLSSEVEASNECGDSEETAQMTVKSGEGDECTITNTVFYEGIPSLSQWGLTIMAFIMLGLGFVAVRRFA